MAENNVSEEGVLKALHNDKGPNAQLVSWKQVDFTEKGDNFASVVTSVELKYRLDNMDYQTSYIVKLTSEKVPKTQLDTVRVLFMKESKFYQELLPDLNRILLSNNLPPLNLPKCVHSISEKGKEQIYFEDLRKRHFKLFDRRKGMDVPHASLVLKELARLHAASFLLQKEFLEPIEYKHSYLLKDLFTFCEGSKDFMLTILRDSLTTAVDMLEKIGGYEESKTWLTELGLRLEDVIIDQLSPNMQWDVVCHGDCWNNNLLFRYDDEGLPVEVMLIDLQVCRKASPATDLNYFMFTSFFSDVRKPNTRNFLKIYHNHFWKVLEAGGISMPFSEEELITEYRDKNTIGAVFAMTSVPVILQTDDIPDSAAEHVDIAQAMRESMEKVLSVLETQPLLKKRFLGVFDELKETGLIP